MQWIKFTLSKHAFKVQLMQRCCTSSYTHCTREVIITLVIRLDHPNLWLNKCVFLVLSKCFNNSNSNHTMSQSFLGRDFLLNFKGSPPFLPDAPNVPLNEAILFIGTVGGLWVTLCPFKKIICFPFNGLRMTNCFQGKIKLRKLYVWHVKTYPLYLRYLTSVIQLLYMQ